MLFLLVHNGFFPYCLTRFERAFFLFQKRARTTAPGGSVQDRTRSGMPCRSPAVTGRRRCRMRGGDQDPAELTELQA